MMMMMMVMMMMMMMNHWGWRKYVTCVFSVGFRRDFLVLEVLQANRF